jgi:glycosyltransferase involved in cell wall biosynthesis
MPLLSVVTPAYNEAQNLPVLYERLRSALDVPDLEWEWVVVDDHSRDGTFDVLCELAVKDPRVRGIRLSRNFGSHTATPCALNHARGDCAAMIAADLQDPPEVILQLLEKWHAGAQVVWAVRAEREGEKASTILFSRLYYWVMRSFVGLKEMPSTGADCVLLDRAVLEAFRGFQEANMSFLALLTWMGFRQETLFYVKKARLHGKSGWTFGKKLKLTIDSITAFSYLPIRLMSFVGFVVAVMGFAYAIFEIIAALVGHPPTGYPSLMVVILVLGGLQMLMMGVLGEYLWRALDESRRRPRYLIEAVTPQPQAKETVAREH